MILADENIHITIISSLRKIGIKVYSIYESSRGLKDEEIIELARELNYSILTEDKDFGEWIFSHHLTGISVIFLRYPFIETEIIAKTLCKFLQKNVLQHPVFVTLTSKKVRVRQL
jgi:predicted nuclease of predicted toxin-antitoxin system